MPCAPCRRIVPGEYLAVDPKGRACMIAAVEKSKFVYVLNRDNDARLTISSPLEAHKGSNLCYALTGLDMGFDNPVFAAIELDYAEADTVGWVGGVGVGGWVLVGVLGGRRGGSEVWRGRGGMQGGGMRSVGRPEGATEAGGGSWEADVHPLPLTLPAPLSPPSLPPSHPQDPTGEAASEAQKHLTMYELDLGLNHVVRKYSEPVDNGANMLIPVPGAGDGPGGQRAVWGGRCARAEKLPACMHACVPAWFPCPPVSVTAPLR